nr:MAG TPA: ribosomal protein L8 [Caudoviricetes sp.]
MNGSCGNFLGSCFENSSSTSFKMISLTFESTFLYINETFLLKNSF